MALRYLYFLVLSYLNAYASNPMIVAHRGSSHQAPENTLPAFELAWEQGADAVEGDFLLTGDGKIVCFHDKDTKRLTGLKLEVAKTSFADLQNWMWGNGKMKNSAVPACP